MGYLDAPDRISVPLANCVGCQQPRVDQRPKNLLGRFTARFSEDRQEFAPLADGTRTFGRDQVSEEFTDNRSAIASDRFEDSFRVSGQGAADASDILVGASRQETPVPIHA